MTCLFVSMYPSVLRKIAVPVTNVVEAAGALYINAPTKNTPMLTHASVRRLAMRVWVFRIAGISGQ
jgi:hypothetical protein